MAQVILDGEAATSADYVKEQTDLPFLVRTDTGRFLRESDVVARWSRRRLLRVGRDAGRRGARARAARA